MPLKSGSSKKVVSGNIKELMSAYKKKGKIGTSKPKNKRAAQKQSVAIALSKAREAIELAGNLLLEEPQYKKGMKRLGQKAAEEFAKSEKATAQGEGRYHAQKALGFIKAGKRAKAAQAKTQAGRQDSSTEHIGTQLIEKLCAKGKAAAKRKFDVYPSAYANMYASAVCSGKVTPGGKKDNK